ncbi:MAG: Cytidylate kinase [Planctomycetota bacterium]
MIVTIDGPAGAGKSTVSRALAARLGFDFLDTGAMYRAITLAAVRNQVAWSRPDELAALARSVRIEVAERRVWLDGDDVSSAIRANEITNLVHYSANNPSVRERMVELQRAAAQGRNMVTEGRDQGTVVFPDAECKIYLTASPSERARRRCAELAARGETVAFAEILAQQQLRDERDAARTCGPLAAARDSIEVLTDGLSPDQVVDRLEALARRSLNLPTTTSTSRSLPQSA